MGGASSSSIHEALDEIIDGMKESGASRKDMMDRFGVELEEEKYKDLSEEDFKEIFRANALMRILSQQREEPRKRKSEPPSSIDDVVDIIRKAKNVIVVTGAGVSTSCGLPDFRSAKGVYEIVGKDARLSDPTDLFNIEFFRKNVRPFFDFAKTLYPGNVEPSPCHRFIKALENNTRLLRNYTQNIDTLENVCGIERVIQCHGSFNTATCTSCGFKCDGEDIKSSILSGKLPFCPKCSKEKEMENDEDNDTDAAFARGVMKSDITFFGEALPSTYEANTFVRIIVFILSSLCLPSHTTQTTRLSFHPHRSLSLSFSLSQVRFMRTSKLTCQNVIF